MPPVSLNPRTGQLEPADAPHRRCVGIPDGVPETWGLLDAGPLLAERVESARLWAKIRDAIRADRDWLAVCRPDAVTLTLRGGLGRLPAIPLSDFVQDRFNALTGAVLSSTATPAQRAEQAQMVAGYCKLRRERAQEASEWPARDGAGDGEC